MENKHDTFGNRLKELRNKMGESQETIAKENGISRARYSHYENNHVEPDIDLIRRFADYFKVETDYLLGRTNMRRKNDIDHEDSFDEHNKIIEDLGIKDLFLENINDLNNLTPKDVEEIKSHFEYIAYKAKKRKEDS